MHVDRSDWAQKKLALNINDNVLKNLEGFSVTSFDPKSTIHKNEFSETQKNEIVDQLLK